MQLPPIPPHAGPHRAGRPPLAGLALVPLALALVAAADPAATEADPAAAVRYSRDVRPILSERCFTCHGPDVTTREANLRLDDREHALADLGGYAAVVPGDLEASELWYRLTTDDPGLLMPPPRPGVPGLSADEVATLGAWIEEGATYEAHWAFVPPATTPTTAGSNPVDLHVDRALGRAGLAPLDPAPPEVQLRRLFLDLTGLPPTLDELDAFLAAPDHGAAYRAWVDRLFDEEPWRTRVAERLTSVWLDRARYADTNGIHMDAGRQIWPWRDWVLEAYRSNLPFDRFVTEQLAGDLLPDATTDQLVASGFLRNHVITDEGGAIDEEYLVEYMADRLETTGSVFLGLTMGCARCHDHKFDPMTQADYFRFGAFFQSNDEPGLYSQLPDANRAFEPFLEVPTPAQTEERVTLASALDELRAARTTPTETERAELSALRETLPGELGLVRHPAAVTVTVSEAGATLEVLEDGSVLASGTADKPGTTHEVQHLTLRTDGTGLRLLQLDALGHESLVNGAPGRADNGNAVLTGIEVEAVSVVDPSLRTPVELAWAWADVAQDNDDYGILQAFDPRENTGWAIAGHTDGGERGALFLAAEPFGFEGGTDVVVTLRYESIWAAHSFGRVRLGLASLDADATPRLPVARGAWYHAGPFPLDSAAGAYAAHFGPATDTTLDPTLRFAAGDGPELAWTYRQDLADGVVAPLTGGVNVHYLGRELWSPDARAVDLRLGSDDGFALYVNGARVAGREVARGVAADQDRATIQLVPGRNTVVLEVVNTGGEAGFFFDLDESSAGEPVAEGEDASAPAGDAVAGSSSAAGGGAPDAAPGPDTGVLVGDLVALAYDTTARAEDERGGRAALDERVLHAWRLERSPTYAASLAREAELEATSAALEAAIPRTMVMRERAEPRMGYVLERGEYDKADEDRPVTPGVPAFLPTLAGYEHLPPGELVPAGQRATRLDLARWLTHPDNPLVPRVTVNRLWQLLFGQGLVATPGDFGYQGAWPTHPELLDVLARDFVASGWDRRALLTTLVTSDAYRRSSVLPAELREADPDGTLLAGYPRRRLEAEVIRDQALYVSGLLVEQLGGPSVKPYQPTGLWREVAMLQSNTRTFERGSGDELWRRSLYTYWKRAAPPPSLLTFDAPTRESCVVRRATTNTPLQALVLWNDEQFVEAARVLAERTWRDTGGDAAAGLARMFRACTGRLPDAEERALLEGALADLHERYAADPEAAAALVAVGDAPSLFAADASGAAAPDAPTLAAWTLVASAVLNLHATITQG